MYVGLVATIIHVHYAHFGLATHWKLDYKFSFTHYCECIAYGNFAIAAYFIWCNNYIIYTHDIVIIIKIYTICIDTNTLYSLLIIKQNTLCT